MGDAVLSVLVSAIVLGSLYALLAAGLSLIWSTLGIFSYAHGSLLVIGGYLVWVLSARAGLPVPVAALLMVPVLALAGVALELIAVRPFADRPDGTLLVMVSTLAVAGAVGGALQLIFGPANRQITPITSLTVPLGGVRLTGSALIALALALGLVGGLIAFLTRTEAGAVVRAVAQDRDVAMVVGIRPSRVYALVFALAAVLAGAAGLVYGTTTTLTPAKGFEPLLTAFVVLVFGGSASLWGTLVGAFAIGLLEAATSYAVGLQWSPIAVFVVLVAVMLVRPEGLLSGRLTPRRTT